MALTIRKNIDKDNKHVGILFKCDSCGKVFGEFFKWGMEERFTCPGYRFCPLCGEALGENTSDIVKAARIELEQ